MFNIFKPKATRRILYAAAFSAAMMGFVNKVHGQNPINEGIFREMRNITYARDAAKEFGLGDSAKVSVDSAKKADDIINAIPSIIKSIQDSIIKRFKEERSEGEFNDTKKTVKIMIEKLRDEKMYDSLRIRHHVKEIINPIREQAQKDVKTNPQLAIKEYKLITDICSFCGLGAWEGHFKNKISQIEKVAMK